MKKYLIFIFIFLFTFYPSITYAADTSQNSSNAMLAIFELMGSLLSFGSSSSPNSSNQISPTPISPNSPNNPNRPNFVFYCQGNTAWKNHCSIGYAGCGPTSMAMVLSSFGLNMNPVATDKIFQQNGWRGCGDFPSYMQSAITSSLLPSLGLKAGPNIAYNKILDLRQAKNYLDQGFLIIGSSEQYPCANCTSAQLINHIFVVDGVDINSSSVSIRDPNNCSYADGNDENPAKIFKNVSSFSWFYAYPIGK